MSDHIWSRSSRTCSGWIIALMPTCLLCTGLSLAGVFSVFSFFLVLGALGLSFTAFGFASGAHSMVGSLCLGTFIISLLPTKRTW